VEGGISNDSRGMMQQPGIVSSGMMQQLGIVPAPGAAQP
jgi:hypothetical protein